MAKLTIDKVLAGKYPAFAGREGETIDATELKRAESDFKVNAKDGKDVDESTASAPAKKVAPKRIKKAPTAKNK